ncbi:MAG: bifunctional ribosomal protein alanine acetyltransferase/tRNA (adenosine(37)-N6)-threonylcarbamoyltransferase complex transferase subunit TsaD, partial [Micrococcales bacterium]|nr:bifunctional ribosomal protein alanine acetyltransferase/tRNA (adenosine(37)-N6)-threonylcarbamoyltransferase complex transferase subunit TsaD [Micrococcales bacterium]
MELKLLMAADVAAVMEIEQDLFGSEAWAERTVLSEIENPFTHYIGIFDGGLVGYAGLNS